MVRCLTPNLGKSRSRAIGCCNGRDVLKFDKHLASPATERPIKYQSHWKGLKLNLAASRLREILREAVHPLSEKRPWYVPYDWQTIQGWKLPFWRHDFDASSASLASCLVRPINFRCDSKHLTCSFAKSDMALSINFMTKLRWCHMSVMACQITVS